MKSSCIALVIVISALATSQSAYANPEKVLNTTDYAPNAPLSDRHQAKVLLTQPATINTTWSNFIGQTNNPKQTSETISVLQDQGCQKINPLDLINNPESFFKQCPKQTNTQSSEPIEYLKVPKLDSGISVTVTKF